MTKHDNVSQGNMKATEFVKNYGLSEAISKVEDCEFLGAGSFNWLGHEVSYKDLKRLVESYELVEKYGDIHGTRLRIRWGQFRYGDTQEFNSRLKQAIADVEACQ